MWKLMALFVLLCALQLQAAPVLVFTGTSAGTSATAVDTTASHTFVKLWNNCTQTVYVAFSSTVTTSNGIPVVASGWIEFDESTSAGNRLYAVVTTGTCDVRVMEKKSP